MENILGMCACAGVSVLSSSAISCVLVYGGNVEYKRLLLPSNIGLVMLCRLFFHLSAVP